MLAAKDEGDTPKVTRVMWYIVLERLVLIILPHEAMLISISIDQLNGPIHFAHVCSERDAVQPEPKQYIDQG